MNSRSDPDCDYVYKGKQQIILYILKNQHIQIVVLSGEMGVGKYHKGIFTRISPTIGVEFLTKKIILQNGVVVKAQIWDTSHQIFKTYFNNIMQLFSMSGSERYRSITTFKISAVGALLVFDITDRESFDQLPYWLNCLREHADENLVVALMANKFDLVMEDEQQRQIMKFVSDNDLLYIGESSALADVNIKEVVETLMENIHEVQQKVEAKKVQSSMKLKEKYSRTDSSIKDGNSNLCC